MNMPRNSTQKKKMEVDAKPTTKIDADAYGLIRANFQDEKAAKELAKKGGKKGGSSPGGQGESGVQQKKDSEWIGYTYKNFEVVGEEVKKKTSSRPSMSSVFRSP